MFDFVRNNVKILQLLLLPLILISFVIVGVEQGYSSLREDSNDLAHVDGKAIKRAEFENELRTQEDRIRAQAAQMQRRVDERLFESPEFRQQALDAVLRREVLAGAVDKLGLRVSDARLQRLFASDPNLAPIRNADGSINQEFLADRRMSSAAFGEQLRADYSSQQVLRGVGGTAIASATASNTALDALLQRREVQVARFEAKNYLAQAQPTDADLKKFYDDPANAKRFEAPEQASVEYLQLDIDALKAGVSVSEADVRKFYDNPANASRFVQSPEERRVSHILIKADQAAPQAQRDAARAKAQALLEQVRKNPAAFAELAKQNSQDEVSAAKGGDLDFFPRKTMVPAFEDAAFALKEGQISELVQTDYGFHILRVTGVHAEVRQPFEAVRAAIEGELKADQAKRAYAQAAEQFTNTVYEQSDSLKPAADLLKLKVRTATLTRPPLPGTPPELADAKLLKAVFDPSGIKAKRNTDAIDVGGNRLVSARVVQHQPARRLPLADVEAVVRGAWITQRTAELAKADAKRQMDAWQKDPAKPGLSAPEILNRTPENPQSIDLVQPVMHAAADKLPVWLTVGLAGQGTAVVRINKVLPADVPAKDRDAAQGQYASLWGNAEDRAYYEALKKRLKVETSKAAAAAISGADAASAAQ